MIRFLLTVLALLTANVAAAQTLTHSPDLPAYQPQAATYAAGTTLNVLGDGSNAKGGTAPAFTTLPEPDDYLLDVPTGWIVPSSPSDYCVAGATVGCAQKKLRTKANSAWFRYDDPLRFWGQPGASHCHEGFGNRGVDAYSTRATLRLNWGSNAAGGFVNGTGYWEPCHFKTINGKIYAIPSVINTIYYTVDQGYQQPVIDDLQPLHLMLRLIMGTNVDDPDNTARLTEVAAANAQPGTAGRYSYVGNGFQGFKCITPDGNPVPTQAGAGYDGLHSSGFKMADGSDPWQGGCHAVSGVPASMVTEFNAPDCWDGVNVWSPTGYDHMRYSINDTVAGTKVCPNHWYKVPVGEFTSFHSTQGWADYSTWTLSSDASVAAKLGHAIRPGASGHADWMNGWLKSVRDRWHCFSLGIGSGCVPHQTQNDTLDENGKMLSDTAAPDGSRNPQVTNVPIDTTDVTKLVLVDQARATMVHVH